MVTDGGNN